MLLLIVAFLVRLLFILDIRVLYLCQERVRRSDMCVNG
jgi:hypothetical protein